LNRNEGFENTFGIYGLKFQFIQNKNINSIIIQPHVVPTVWDYLFCEACEELFFFPNNKINQTHSKTQTLGHFSKYIILCSTEERKSYRFGMA